MLHDPGAIYSCGMADDDFTPCPDCVRPEHCGGRWPDDDAHMPGRLRGCFAEKSRGVDIANAERWRIRTRETEMDRDNEAFRRLKKTGFRPNRVDGSALLEKTLT